MISVLGRSGSLAGSLKVTTHLSPIDGKIIPISADFIAKAPPIILRNISSSLKTADSLPKTASSLIRSLPTSQLKIKSGLGIASQVRFNHHDFSAPNFDYIRNKNTVDTSKSVEDNKERRFTHAYLQSGLGLVATAYMAKGIVRGAIGTLAPAKDQLAIAKIEINISEIPEGKSMTFKWRGSPIFVKNRTENEIARERAVDISSLRDPQTDEARTMDPRWLVVIGVCTHLGCIPIANAGDYGGYYCPCHGSHYDGSGRIRKGPAPLNLTVPKHTFPQPDLLIVG